MLFLKIALCLTFFLSPSFLPSADIYGDAATTEMQKRVVRIMFEKNQTGELRAVVYDIMGKKQILTFGTFIGACTEALLGKSLLDCNLKKSESIQLFYERDERGILVTYMIDAQGNKHTFSLNSLLTALPKTLQACGTSKSTTPSPPAKQTNDQVVHIYFEKNRAGILHSYLVHPDGRRELLNLGSLLSAMAELFTGCHLEPKDNRSIYIAFEKQPALYPATMHSSISTDEKQAIQIDAYGLKEELNMDNLITAATETLQVCNRFTNIPQTVYTTPPKGPSLRIKLEKNAKKNIQAVLIDSKGKRVDLTLGSLLSATAGIIPCRSEIIKNRAIEISFEKDDQGNFQPYIVDVKGNKKSLNLLGDLMNIAAYFCIN
jgi:hypothetical protein